METSTTSNTEARVVEPKKQNLTIKIAGAAIFGALSIVISIFTTSSIPRVPGWYIAYFDPVSLIWVAAFLIFGIETGILTCVIGAVGLIPFDPTNIIGPIMKFAATIWLILIPYLIVKLKSQGKFSGQLLKNPTNYTLGMLLAWIARCIVMVLLNIVALNIMGDSLDFFNLSWLGYGTIGGAVSVAVTVILIITLQSAIDAIVPYLLIFKGKIYDSFHIY